MRKGPSVVSSEDIQPFAPPVGQNAYPAVMRKTMVRNDKFDEYADGGDLVNLNLPVVV